MRADDEGASFPIAPALVDLPASYGALLAELMDQIGAAQRRAALAVTRELVGLYWSVGATIVRRQQDKEWGDSVVERLAVDLRTALPGLEGFSARNIWRMRAFFLAWSGSTEEPTRRRSVTRATAARRGELLPRPVSELPWGHNIALLQKLENRGDRLWYAQQAHEHSWSLPVLVAQIAKRAHARAGKATTNFARALPPGDAERAQQALKDPYTFDFLTVGPEAHERVTERDLVAHVREFLLELGAGFAFVGNQVKLTVGDDDYYLDLLFYHLRLRRYVVVELKATPFKPEHAGKMNFYLSAVDDLMKHPDDAPSIGLLLCRSHNRLQVEYALRDVAKPIGVAQWETKLVEALPENFRGSLPTVEEFEAAMRVPGGAVRAKVRVSGAAAGRVRKAKR